MVDCLLIGAGFCLGALFRGLFDDWMREREIERLLRLPGGQDDGR